eukprot:CAMPEP_0172715598 /NCGR_PEP_ID=MMETSP1074-20121228/67635_1 /TAXON_ID=2916 /ORGANISM="Ceratium fusus, Strain PA161109" /LENGTH=502 /DNA_ID=CAMNT_0013540191 /DNA_START=88 /DNA_END=1593 /DNA_ORIENTATION=+
MAPSPTEAQPLTQGLPQQLAGKPIDPWGNWHLRDDSVATPARARARSHGPMNRRMGASSDIKSMSQAGLLLMATPHIPCLLQEAVDGMLPPHMRRLDGSFDGTYVDCTFGRGGHSREILRRLGPKGRLFAFDVDPEAVAVARQLEVEDARFQIIHRPFGEIADVFKANELNGVLIDLGVSSPQLDDIHRGFNVFDGRLDMRMNQAQGLPASEWLKCVSAEELAWVIHSYGEDDDLIMSERIAEHILARQRELGPINSSRQLSDIIRQAKCGISEHGFHPAKLTFQAIRVFLNQEMQQLDHVLQGAMDCLGVDGRCCVITFKKKEANAVNRFVREHEEPDAYLNQVLSTVRLCELFPLLTSKKAFAIRQICEPVRPSAEELDKNRRCRSSAVHILQCLPRRSSFQEFGPGVIRIPGKRLREPAWWPPLLGSSNNRPLTHGHLSESTMPSDDGDLFDPPLESGVITDKDFNRSDESGMAGYIKLNEGERVYVEYSGKTGDHAGW